MGIVMEFGDVVGWCEDVELDYASDLTDSEGDEECVVTPRASERVVPRSCKRTYGVVVDAAVGVGVVPERSKRSRFDEQFERLRAAIPNLCTNEKGSILSGAYEYIEKLQRQVQELSSELDTDSSCSDDDDMSSCEFLTDDDEERPVDSKAALVANHGECRGCSHPTVEVVRTEEGLRIHIQCEKRPHVLADIMEMLESSGMSVDQVSIAYHEDSQFVFDCVGSQVDGEDVADSKLMEICLKSLVAEV